MKLKLPAELYSAQQLALVITELERYASWYEHEKVRLEVGDVPAKLANIPALELPAEKVLESWQGANPVSDESLNELLAELRELKDNAPQIHVTLAAMPSDGIKRQIVTWMRQEIDPRSLVTFRFNGTLLGGMVLRVGSRIIDLSFRRKLLAARSNFAGVLRRV